MKEESKTSLKNFFKANLASTAGSEDDRSYRFFLKKRDTGHSSTSSLDKLSSSASNLSSKNSASEKKGHSHLSLKRFLKKLKHEDRDKKEPKEKDKKRHHHHLLPLHGTSPLYRKYTKGKLLGSGASGLVNLVHLKNRSKGGGGGIIFTFSSTF
jgi:hypothetical protein